MIECEVCKSTHKVEKFNNVVYLCSKHYKQMYRHGKIFKRTVFDANEIIIYNEWAEILLYDKYGNIRNTTKISLDKVDVVKCYKWHKSGAYVASVSNGKSILLHRLITGANINQVVDHISHDKFDNRDCNLRVCTHQQNSFNCKTQKNNLSGTPGVSYRSNKGKWRAYIMIDRKQVNLGHYLNKQDAINARKVAERKYFGEFMYKEGV